MFDIILTIIIVIVIIILLNYKLNIIDLKESFDTFSPYKGNNSYPFVYQQKKDNEMLQKSLKPWELPFNCNNPGYYNAEPNNIPPLVTMCSYQNIENVPY